MDAPQLIALDDVVLRRDLDPRLGQRDADLIAQYAEIFDELPPIEINRDKELIDGWHRILAAQEIARAQIAYVIVDTDSDDDLRDRMYAANLRHGVQYSREQKRAYGIALHGRELSAKDIARLSGVGVSTVYRWTKELREQDKDERDAEIQRLRDEGYSQQEIADLFQVAQRTISEVLSGNSQMRNTAKQNETEAENKVEPEIEVDETESVEEAESEIGQESDKRVAEEQEAQVETESGSASAEAGPDESPADEQGDALESEPEPDTDKASVDENAAAPKAEPVAPQELPDHILETARAVMVGFVETQPDAYVARLEVSPSEWMTITDDSLSNELERELLTSAAAMCLWQEWMIWYLGGRTSAFTDAFGKIGPVFVRGRAGQWRIVSRLRSVLRRLWA